MNTSNRRDSEPSCAIPEWTATQERIAYFIDLLARLRKSSRPEELALVTSGYRAEVERMQREVLDGPTRPATPSAQDG